MYEQPVFTMWGLEVPLLVTCVTATRRVHRPVLAFDLQLWMLSVVSCVHCTHVEAISVIRRGKHSLCFHLPKSICK